MSLGLGDLNKKRRPATSVAKSESPKKPESKASATESIPKIVNEPTTREQPQRRVRSRTARPWSHSGLAHGHTNRNRRRTIVADAAMNDEWASVHAEPLFWVDFSQHSRLACIQEKLTALEERVQQAVRRPWQMIQRLCF